MYLSVCLSYVFAYVYVLMCSSDCENEFPLVTLKTIHLSAAHLLNIYLLSALLHQNDILNSTKKVAVA